MEKENNIGELSEAELTAKIEELNAAVSEKEAKVLELDIEIEAKEAELKKLDAEGNKKKKAEKPLQAKLSGNVVAEFVLPKFIFEGKEYESKELEKAVSEGDEEAIRVVTELLSIGSTVVKVVEK